MRALVVVCCRLRARAHAHHGGEAGFSLMEMIIAITLIAVSMMALAQMLFSSMGALNAAGQRSTFLELATEEMEQLRALDYDEVCVTAADAAANYDVTPPYLFEERPAVLPAAPSDPCGVVPEDDPPPPDGASPYTVRRWVTWTNSDGQTGAASLREFKRITVELEWQEQNRADAGATRDIRLVSVLYPGGLGTVVSTTDQPPVAVAAASPSLATIGQTVTFDAGGSSDPEGGSLSYEWTFPDSTTSVAATTTKSFSTTGHHDVRLTVTDDAGGVAEHVVRVTVGNAAGNNPPTADLVALTPVTGVAPFLVEFDGSGSTDPDAGDLLTYEWNWGDGSAVSPAQLASHTFQAAGTYTVTLTVTDLAGASDTATTTVTALPLDCSVSSGHFRNPSGSSTANLIRIRSNGQPADSSFRFEATSNSACTGMSVSLPTASGSPHTVSLSLASEVAGVKTWRATQSVGGSTKFTVGSLTGRFNATSASGAASHAFPFRVQS